MSPLADSPLSERLCYSTVRIQCETARGISTGSGFFYLFPSALPGQSVPVIVTNRHVVAGATKGTIHLHTALDGESLPNAHIPLSIHNFESLWIGHPDPNVDLCVLPAAPIFEACKTTGRTPFFIPIVPPLIPTADDLKDLGAMEDVIMIGYPNGIWDDVNNLPIIRRGVTATHPNKNYCGKREFMVDMACFPGSSGSPVFLYNTNPYTVGKTTHIMGTRLKLLGILYAGPQYSATGVLEIRDIPSVATPVAISSIPNNLGLVIKADRLLEFSDLIEQLSSQPADPISAARNVLT